MSGGVKQFIHPQMTQIVADEKMEKTGANRQHLRIQMQIGKITPPLDLPLEKCF